MKKSEDLSRLKTTIDQRFTQLEKNMGNLQPAVKSNDVFVYMKTPFLSKLNGEDEDDNKNNFTLSLNFEKDLKSKEKSEEAQWNNVKLLIFLVFFFY